MKATWRAMTVLLLSPQAALAGEGRIVFARGGDIWISAADGTGAQRLTDDPADEFDADLSPDGTRIAFRSHRDGNPEVYVMNADGSEQVNLTKAPGSDYSPAFSPDGSRIAFASNRSNAGGNDIWVMDAEGGNPQRLTTIPGIQEYPSWSPDGARLAFACTFGRRLPEGVGDFEICVVNADGSGLAQITDEAEESKLPAWSPDGTLIAFESSRLGWPTMPGYTPPGYDPGRSGEFDLYVMGPDGSEQRNVTNNPREDDSMAAWVGGDRLIFSRYGCLMSIGLAETAAAPVGDRGCDDIFPDWGPN